MTISRITASSGSALPTWLDCQRSKVQLPHFRFVLTAKDLKFCFRTSAVNWLSKLLRYTSTLPWLPMMWTSASASPLCFGYPWRDRSSVPHFCSTKFSEDVKFRFRTSVLPSLPRSEVQLSHFRSARTSKDLKLHFHTSALPWLPNMWSSALRTSVLPGLRKMSSFASALVRSGLPKMWRSASAFHLCRDFQRGEVPPPHFYSALTIKDLKFGFPANTLL